MAAQSLLNVALSEATKAHAAAMAGGATLHEAGYAGTAVYDAEIAHALGWQESRRSVYLDDAVAFLDGLMEMAARRYTRSLAAA
jgi:hypothetical protein